MQLKKEFGEIFVFLYEKCPKTVLFVYFSLTLKELDHMTTRHMSVVWIVDKWYSDLQFICTLNSLDFLPHSNHLVWLKTIFWDPNHPTLIPFIFSELTLGKDSLSHKAGWLQKMDFLIKLNFFSFYFSRKKDLRKT